MLRVLSHPRRLCTGLTRRDLLQVGGLGTMSLGLDTLLSHETARAANGPRVQGELSSSFGKAKRCVVLFLYGSPSQLETLDMKPDAPVEIRGTMQPIPSSLPGCDICEHLPNMAKIMDRTTVVRSLTHPNPIHGVAYAMTGVAAIDVNGELSPNDPRHHPYFGSVVEYFDRQRRGGKLGDFVQNAALPFPFSSQRTDQPYRAGPYGAFLGASFNPTWTEFIGQGTKTITKARPGFSWTGLEPYLGCTPDSHFRLAATDTPPDMTVDRLNRRRSLLQQFEDQRRDLDRTLAGVSHGKMQEMAFSLMSSTKVADALDVRKESPETRELYGHTLFGQSCLAARRMLEAGTRLVSVFWDEFGLAGDAWDTHYEHFPRMVDQLLPGLDKAFSGLILDLERRGLLDETLVVCVSEHGRTPKINNAIGGGRDHWSQAYSALFAGGGIAKGRVIGSTNAHAAEVTDHPLSPKDMLATMYHLLGIAPHSALPDRVGRPQPMLPEGSHVVTEMLA